MQMRQFDRKLAFISYSSDAIEFGLYRAQSADFCPLLIHTCGIVVTDFLLGRAALRRLKIG
jgi:hypothetical protein